MRVEGSGFFNHELDRIRRKVAAPQLEGGIELQQRQGRIADAAPKVQHLA